MPADGIAVGSSPDGGSARPITRTALHATPAPCTRNRLFRRAHSWALYPPFWGLHQLRPAADIGPISALPERKTDAEDSRSKIVQNHPHDFTKRLFLYPPHSFIILFNFSVVLLIVHPVHKDLCSQVDESGVTV
jgi:hypothetical protein